MESTNLIGERIKAARGARSVEWLAVACDCTSGTVRNWETGRTTPSASDLSKIATATERTTDWLVGLAPPLRGAGSR